MAKAARRRLVVGLLLALAGATGIQATGNQPTGNRVRTRDIRIQAAITSGSGKSPTFRRLLESIDALDGIVYVEDGPCGIAPRSCLLHDVVIAGRFRLLNIHVDPRRPEAELIVSIAHELRHALEVLSDPRIRSAIAIAQLYRVIGERSWGNLETRVAVETSLAVSKEINDRPR